MVRDIVCFRHATRTGLATKSLSELHEWFFNADEKDKHGRQDGNEKPDPVKAIEKLMGPTGEVELLDQDVGKGDEQQQVPHVEPKRELADPA